MTVKQLIKELKKMPPDTIVYWADHDHGQYEFNNVVGSVELIDRSNMDDYEKENEIINYMGTNRSEMGYEYKYVVIRP